MAYAPPALVILHTSKACHQVCVLGGLRLVCPVPCERRFLSLHWQFRRSVGRAKLNSSSQILALLSRDLALEDICVASISAEQTPAARTRVVDQFREGIDFLNVQTVVSYDFPHSSIDYIHRQAPP